jgi:hypothetical protein
MSAAFDDLLRAGVALAPTRHGARLPIIDVTLPRFALPDDEASVEALRREVDWQDRLHRLVTAFVMGWMLNSAARRSRFVHAMVQPGSSFLDGLTTYAIKLGCSNLLPPYDGEVDQRFSRSPYATLLRLRMQQTAELIAAAAARELRGAPRRPLHLIDIAGGPAMDAINAVIIMAASSPELLGPVEIHVLDLDEEGPAFGASALDELRREGRPLHGITVSLRRLAYDWSDTGLLDALVTALTAGDAVVVASSEGGLFEYGSDDEIIRNLSSLRAGGRGASAVIGSVTSSDQRRRSQSIQSRLKLHPRGLEGFAPLAAAAGYRISQSRWAVISDQVELSPLT